MYRKIDETVLKELRQIAGEDNVLVSEEAREKYSHDEVAGLRREPEAVVMVKSADVVAAVMKLAQRRNFPVTPLGAGYGVSGGAVPAMGGLVMSLERMNKILEIDHENLMVTVEPGVITGNLHRAVEEVGLFYPPDPASLDSCGKRRRTSSCKVRCHKGLCLRSRGCAAIGTDRQDGGESCKECHRL